ncbi:SCO family protein [Maricaulis virginensis]|uniref:Electron transporter SenC n=1 Tax=Maricaulis virginensis TaxID=144022 RepID=A0A9W6IMK6_9PROT|nr:SCO family protein [Maricaulis virginensis]GLK52763.1 electron transporter SenC [Maricaulis virginensis]
MPRPVIWLLIAAPATLMIVFFILVLTRPGAEAPRQAGVRISGEANIGGPFTLVDQTGATVTEADFRGKAMLIYFGYTYCPDICPFSLQVMAAALDQMEPEERARIQPVLITVDPERDTVEQLARYVTSPAFPDGLTGLTGTEEQIAEVTAAYRVVYRRAGEGDDYLMDHSSIVYLMNSEGEFVDVFTHGTDPAAMASRLQDFLEEEGA